jgi:hypothetical protein
MVFAKDYPEARLGVKVMPNEPPPSELDRAIAQLARHLWGSNCHFGLIVTPLQTYVLRDDFIHHGPEAMHVTETLSTATLLSRSWRSLPQPLGEQQLAMIVHSWLRQLASSYEAALPDDPEVTRALFPEIVGAVSEGRVVSEVAA